MHFINILKRFLFENYIEDSENFEDLTVPKINCINGYIPDNSTICICNEGYTTSLEIKINEDGSINKCDISISDSNINNNNEIVEKKSKKNFLSFILSKILPVFLIAMVVIWFIVKIYLKCKKKKNKEKNSDNNNDSKKNKNNNINNNKHINKRNKKEINFDDIESTTSRNYINNSINNLYKKNFNDKKQNYNNNNNYYNQKKIYYDDNFYNNNNNNKKVLYFNKNDYINYIKKSNSKTPEKYLTKNSFQSDNKKYMNNIKSIKYN